MKKTWIIIAILILILLAIGGFMFLGKSSKSQPSQKVAVQQTTTKPSSIVQGTIKSILGMGKTQQCAITYPNTQTTGTVYIADKKLSGDFTVKTTGGKETVSHVISDGTYMYIWSSAMANGIKMKIPDVTKNAPTGTVQNQNFDINQKVSLNCSPWIADNSKFTPPLNINFTDMSNLLPQTSAQPSQAAGTSGTKVSPCDAITNPTAKAACENALK